MIASHGPDASARVALLRQNVAVDATFLVFEMLPCAIEFFLDALGNDRQSDQLRMRVLQNRAGGFAVVLAQEQIPQTNVPSQIEDTIAVRPEQIFDPLSRERWRASGNVPAFQ